MRVSLSTCLCLLSATASATLPPLGNKDILYPTLQSAREAATLVNEAQPLVGVSSPYPYPPRPWLHSLFTSLPFSPPKGCDGWGPSHQPRPPPPDRSNSREEPK
ncbi:hypothetical protein PCL_06983 [Purpureocillium lilacinum]|uniref:Uncharacterized protein n=1 Tax=Purpureocillium lilacinum TaxID=33203 RepID=A0A2U3DTK9_PURLI|nr:hypothetical protein PCL_06983 [Purpureocillium lilacinum]